MKISKLLALLLFVLFFSSCASILNPAVQKVDVFTNCADCEVSVQIDKVAVGDSFNIKVNRNAEPKQIILGREGYKPEYYSIVQYKRSPLYILSWVPFAILIYPPLFDLGEKAFNYDNTVRIERNLLPIHKRQQGEKFLVVTKSAFNINSSNYTLRKVSYQGYREGMGYGQTKALSEGEKGVEISNSIFTDKLNDVLKQNAFIDTLNVIFKDVNNTLYVQAEVTSLTFNSVYFHDMWIGRTAFWSVDGTIKWTILDIYDQVKYSEEIIARSGEFSIPTYLDDNGPYISKSMEDFVLTSFLTLTSRKEVTELLKISNTKEEPLEVINLQKPSASPKTIEEAKAATVTVQTENGHGSGCLITYDGYIITNFHVISGQKNISIITDDGWNLKAAVVRYNQEADIALLKVDTIFPQAFVIPALKNFSLADEVFAIGTPTSVELGQSVSKGIISSLRKVRKSELIQTDVSINPGNSGGALVDKSGNLLGVVNSKIRGLGIEGIAFCIPAYKVLEMLSVSY